MNKAKQYISKRHQTNLIEHEALEATRINKFLSEASFCSRREADRYVEEQRVKINGEVALIGSKVVQGDIVEVDEKIVKKNHRKVYIMLNKPVGITCTNDLKVKHNIRAFVDYSELIYPIGRLDKQSEGLILLTNDGDIVNKILRAEFGHEKEYIVKVQQKITPEFIQQMQQGVVIYNQVAHQNQMTAPCKVSQINEDTFKIILKQGLNRQIRRMCEALGFYVESLKRIRIMSMKLGELPTGYWRYLSSDELSQLNQEIKIHKKLSGPSIE